MAVNYNISCDQGVDSTFQIQIANTANGVQDISNCTLIGFFKPDYDSSHMYAFNFTTDPTNGMIYVTVSGNVTSNINYGKYVYSIGISDNISQIALLNGNLTINPSAEMVMNTYPIATTNSFIIDANSGYN